MQRFYLPDVPAETVTVSEPDFFHQVSRVLRCKAGDRAVLFSDAGGGEYEITEIGKKSVSFSRIRSVAPSCDPRLRVTLYQAVPNKYEKIEYLLQKGTEVGISEFVFFPAERSQKLAITPNKTERFESIVREALEQCGGFRKPAIRFEAGFPAVPQGMPLAFLHTDADAPSHSLPAFVRSFPTDVSAIGILVGPEGGFTADECERAKLLGATCVRAGERILRTETA